MVLANTVSAMTPVVRPTATMEQTIFEIDGNDFANFNGFIGAFNRGFVSHVGGEWNGNLDAFSDYLSWADNNWTLRWRNSAKSRVDLGYAAMADWLSENSTRCHSTNRALVQQRLDDANRESGSTLFDCIVEIIRDNDQYVDLLLE